MPPEEQSHNQPPHGRQPFPRRSRMSIDGMTASGARRPMPSNRPVQRPLAPPSRPNRGTVSDVLRPTPQPLSTVAQPESTAGLPSAGPSNPATLPGAPLLPASPAAESAPAPVAHNPPQPQTAPAPLPTPQPATPATVAQASPPEPRTFTPPPRKTKRLRKILLIALPVLIVLVIGAGAWYWWHQEQIRNDPTNVFHDALDSSLSTMQLQTNTTAPGGGAQADFDFSKLTDPLVSSQSDVTYEGSDFEIEGYGSAQNTFVSYAKFPAYIPSSITNVAQNAWVQLRSQGKEPTTVSTTLSNLADPRYQDFGPLVFGDFPLSQRPRLVNFLLSQHIYDYKKSAVTKATLNGNKVFVYPVTLNVDFLQVFIQSVAVLEGFTPSDVQAAVNGLNNYKGDTVTFYVSASTHRFVRAMYSQNGQNTTVDYSGYNSASLLNEPQTNLTWQDFAAVQQQIEQKTAAHAQPAVLDAQREADLNQLHLYLANYFTSHSFYPAYADLADPTWVATNMPGVDPDAFRDPLSTTAGLAASPKKGEYSYQTVNPAGKSCSNDISAAVSQLCTTYTLTAVLSTGKPYSVTNP